VGKVRQQQEEARTRKDAFQKRQEESRPFAKKIVELAGRAWPHEDGFTEILGTLTGATLLADVFVGGIEAAAGILTLGLLKTAKTDSRGAFLKEFSHYLREAWGLYREFRDGFTFDDRQAVRDMLCRVQAELGHEWDKLKTERQQTLLERSNRKRELIAQARRLSEELPAAAGQKSKALIEQWKAVGFIGDKAGEADLWDTFRSTLDAFWEQRKASRQERMEQAREAIQANIEKLRSSIEHDEGVLKDKKLKLENVHEGCRANEIRETLQEAIKNVEEKIERKQGWIQEQAERIASIERSFQALR
jgi:hypothetical protein